MNETIMSIYHYSRKAHLEDVLANEILEVIFTEFVQNGYRERKFCIPRTEPSAK